jgi:hypothetical protein
MFLTAVSALSFHPLWKGGFVRTGLFSPLLGRWKRGDGDYGLIWRKRWETATVRIRDMVRK